MLSALAWAGILAAVSACADRDASEGSRGSEERSDPVSELAGAGGELDGTAETPNPPDAGVPPGDRHVVIDDAGIATTIHESPDLPTPTPLPVSEVSRRAEAGKATLCDVNGPRARAHFGVIPGALELSHPSHFDLDELPKRRDEPLIFYCGSRSCGASLRAGTRALLEGYSEVYVLRSGIAGWLEAGEPTRDAAEVSAPHP